MSEWKENNAPKADFRAFSLVVGATSNYDVKTEYV